MTEQTMEYAREVGVIPEVISSMEEAGWENGIEVLWQLLIFRE